MPYVCLFLRLVSLSPSKSLFSLPWSLSVPVLSSQADPATLGITYSPAPSGVPRWRGGPGALALSLHAPDARRHRRRYRRHWGWRRHRRLGNWPGRRRQVHQALHSTAPKLRRNHLRRPRSLGLGQLDHRRGQGDHRRRLLIALGCGRAPFKRCRQVRPCRRNNCESMPRLQCLRPAAPLQPLVVEAVQAAHSRRRASSILEPQDGSTVSPVVLVIQRDHFSHGSSCRARSARGPTGERLDVALTS